MSTISFVSIGEPIPKGSTTSRNAMRKDGSLVFKNGRPVIITHDQSGKKGKSSEEALALHAMAARNRLGLRMIREASVEVAIRFYTRRPKWHYGTGRNASVLKESAPARPATKPDADKLIRHVLDAITGVIYQDDGQVASIRAEKHYVEGSAEHPRTEVWVRELDVQTVGPVVHEDQLEIAVA